MRGIALEYVCSEPWAILPDHLDFVRAVAGRVEVEPLALAAKDGRPLDGARKVEMRGDTAVIPLRGTVMRYANMFSALCPNGATSLDSFAKDFQAALDNPAVRAIVLDVDSPGGEAKGVGEMASRIASARGKKPMCAYVGGMGCSAAYWIASACDSIVANESALLGSIGVICSVDTRERAGELTLRSTQSPNKAPSPATEKGRSDLQSRIDALADVFISAVAANRGMSADDVIGRFGAGGTATGSAAVAAGMADSTGDLESCIASMSPGQNRRMSFSANLSQDASEIASEQPGTEEMPSRWESFMAWMNQEVSAGAGANAPEAPAATETEAAPEPEATEVKSMYGDPFAAMALAQAEEFLGERVGTLLTPAEVPGLVAVLADLAVLDATSPLLAGGKPVSRAAQFKAGIDARRPLGITETAITEDATEAAEKLAAIGRVLPSKASTFDEAVDAERKARVARMKEASRKPGRV